MSKSSPSIVSVVADTVRCNNDCFHRILGPWWSKMAICSSVKKHPNPGPIKALDVKCSLIYLSGGKETPGEHNSI